MPTDASEGGECPRRRPRLGVDCWARAFVYRAIHRYLARLDAMLAYLTRRFLDRTPVSPPAGPAGHALLRICNLLATHPWLVAAAAAAGAGEGGACIG